jgi:chemotaxis protein MotB
MSSRKKDAWNEEEHKAETAGMMRWLLTYADMITLLLGLFIILAASSKKSTANYEIIAAQAAKVFGAGSSLLPGAGKILPGSTGLLPYPFLPTKRGYPEKPKPPGKGPTGTKTVFGPNGATVIFTDAGAHGVQFESAKVDLNDDAKANIAKVFDNDDALKKMLQSDKFKIQVIGHTDSDALRASFQFPSNWELSAGRAGQVVAFLKVYYKNKFDVDLDNSRFTITGAADTQPYDPALGNSTPEAKALNRRVEIKLIDTSASPQF